MSEEQQQQNNEEQQPTGMSFEELVARSILAIATGHSYEGGVHTRAEHLASFGDDAAASCAIYLRERIEHLSAFETEVYVSSFLASVQASIAKVGLRSVRGRLIPIAVTVAEETLNMAQRVPARIRQLEQQFAHGQAQANMPMSRQPQIPVGAPAAAPGSAPAPTELSARSAAILRALGGA